MESKILLFGHVLVKVPVREFSSNHPYPMMRTAKSVKATTHVEGFMHSQSRKHKEKEGSSYLIRYDQPPMLMTFIKLNEQENEKSDH